MGTALPPLNALRAFEAAGRHANFSRAADELNVTVGAVSRQVSNLEVTLGIPLFTRNSRGVKLTPEGEAYREALTDSFTQLRRATRRLVDSHKEHHLHIHCAVTFTQRWLLRRLVTFQAAFPGRELETSTVLPPASELIFYPTDVSIDNYNAEAIRAAGPELCGHPLLPVDLVPVCSPRLCPEHGLSTGLKAWKDVTLLVSSARPKDWELWADAAGAPEVYDCNSIPFASSSLAYEAAIEGIGVAIGMRALVQDDLREGRLVVAHPATVGTGESFYLIYSRAAAGMRQVREFRDWILAEAGVSN
jgi:LysR family glycine cleavage system transcriptional activator